MFEYQKYKQSKLGVAVLVLLAVVFGSVFAFAHGGEDHGDSIAGAEHSYPIVSVLQPKSLENDESTFEVSGVVKAANQADIYPLKSGNITNLYVNTGDFVKKGQLIATITPEKSDVQLSAEISLLEKELELLKEQKEIESTNFSDQIALLENNASEKKDLLLNANVKSNEGLASQTDGSLELAKQQYESNLQIIELKIEAAKNSLNAQDAIIENKALDMIDAINNFLYTSSVALRSSGEAQKYLRDNVVNGNSTTIYGFSNDYIAFYKAYQSGKYDQQEFFGLALDWAKKVRVLGSGDSSFNDDPELVALLNNLDAAIDDFGELQSDNLSLIAEIQDLEASKEISALELEQAKLQLEQELQQNELRLNQNAEVENLNLDSSVITEKKQLELDKTLSERAIDARIAGKEAEIAAMRKQIGWGTNVYAPFGGSVVARHVSVGQSVNTSTGLFSLVDESRKFIRFYVSEDQFPFIEEGREVVFASQFTPSVTYKTEITRIAKGLSAGNGQILVEADIDGREDLERILTNMNVLVTVPLFDEGSSEELYVIDERAIDLGSSSNVWLVNSDVEVEKRKVTVDFVFAGSAYVSEGLDGLEWVIVDSPIDLKDGLEVDTRIFNQED